MPRAVTRVPWAPRAMPRRVVSRSAATRNDTASMPMSSSGLVNGKSRAPSAGPTRMLELCSAT